MERDLFIMIHNNLIKEKSKQHLTINELYLYSYLYTDLFFMGSMKTTISLISTFIPVTYNKKKEDNLKEIKNVLLSLQNKNVIVIINSDGEKISDSFRANDGVVIHLIENENIGFTKIDYEKFQTFSSMKLFYIYTLVAKWSNMGYFECDYDRWARLLNCSRNTAIKYIEQAVEDKIIYKNTGDYIENEADKKDRQKTQALNKYSIYPFKEEDKTRITKKKEYIKEKEASRTAFVPKENKIAEIINYDNVF